MNEYDGFLNLIMKIDKAQQENSYKFIYLSGKNWIIFAEKEKGSKNFPAKVEK